MQRRADNLGRVDDAGFDHVGVFAVLGVEAPHLVFRLEQLADHHRAVFAGVVGDLTGRRGNRPADDVDADLLVVVGGGQLVQAASGVDQGDAAARHDAFLDRRAGGVHGVVDAVLTLLDFHLGGAAHTDDGDPAGQFGQTLLQFFAVVIGGGFLDLGANLPAARFDVAFFADAVDDGGLVLGDVHPLARPQHVEGDVLQLDAEILGDDGATGQDGDVLEHGLAAITEARRLDGGDLQAATQLVDDQGGERLALDVLGDDQQRTAGLHHRFQDRQHGLQVGQFFLVQQNVRVVQLGDHFVGVGDEIRREIAAVELHAFDDIQFGGQAFGLLDGDDTLVADFFHRLGDHFADLTLAIGGDGADLGDFGRGRDFFRRLAKRADDVFDGDVDAALEVHRVHAGGDGFRALAHDGLGQNGRGGGAVTGVVIGLGGHFADHLGAHVFELVGQFDFLGDGHAVFRDARRAKGFVEHDITALGAEGDLHGVGQDVDALQHLVPRLGAEFNVFRSHFTGFPLLG